MERMVQPVSISGGVRAQSTAKFVSTVVILRHISNSRLVISNEAYTNAKPLCRIAGSLRIWKHKVESADALHLSPNMSE
jgi:hypothetical protein